MIAAIGDALEDAELTVDELTDAIRERTGPWAVERTMDAFQDKWPRWRQLTSTAAHRGVLCFGPNKGRNVTYTNPHRWLPGFVPDDGSRGRARLRPPLSPRVRAGHRPSTSRGGWARPPRAARAAFEAMGDELEPVDVDGEPRLGRGGRHRRPVVAASRASASSPTSMPTWSLGSRGHACFRARPRLAP